MLLTDRLIREAVESGHVAIRPYSPDLIQPASIDMRLDMWFRRLSPLPPGAAADAAAPADTSRLVPAGDTFTLRPGEFVLASTLETITLPADIAGRLEGKSTLGRLGLLTHATAGWIDPGFSGTITLELSNLSPSPIILRPGMPIGQLCLYQCAGPAERPYGAPGLRSRYQGQRGPTPARAPGCTCPPDPAGRGTERTGK